LVNRYIGLYLAKKVCPDKKWKIVESKYHTTVMSSDKTQIFDLIAYAWNTDRFKAYCLNEAYIETDSSLGANEVMEMIGKE
jgi:5-methylcytosine-specific restriction endonuclease McrBC regulatory subunit McrC